MQNLSSTLGRLAVVLTSALALSSCNRAEYAFLPKSASYLGTTTAAPKARVATASVAAPAQTAPAAPLAETPAMAPEIEVATAPAAPRAATAVAPTPTAPAEVAAAAPEAATVATPAPQKLSLVQRIALAKVTKKLNKLATKSPQFKQGDNTAHSARISGNLRTGLILLLIGLLLSIFGGAIGTIGFIIALIGVVFLVLWLLDEL